MKRCIFCEMPGSETARKIYEDRICSVIINRYPVGRGHLIVVSKRHYADMLSAPDPVIAHMFGVAKKLGKRTKRKLRCMGMDIGVNIGGSGSIRHFHIHILPRYSNRMLHFASAKTKRNEIRKAETKELVRLLKL